jgi:hypothetical protein
VTQFAKSNFKRLFIPFIIYRNKDFSEKCPLVTSLIGSPNINIVYSEFSDFSLAKDGEREWLSRVPTRYKKLLECTKI